MLTSPVSHEERFLQQVEDLRAAHTEARIEAARQSFPDFLEEVMINERGERWVCGAHQREWSAYMDDASIELLLLIGPRGSAKSTTIQARCAWEIGRNPDLCIKYVCGRDDKAMDRLRFIKKIICSERYRLIFPHIREASVGEEQSKHKMTVERPSAEGIQDATLEASSVSSAGTGGRCNLLVLDDVIDSSDAIRTPAVLPQTKKAVEEDWMNTLYPEGKVWGIGTFWSFDPPDLYVEYSQHKEWTRWIKPACGSDSAGNLTEPVLWPERWPLEKLRKKIRQVGIEVFWRQYLLRGAVQRAELFSRQNIAGCKSADFGLGDVPEGRTLKRVGIGMDPAKGVRGGSRACVFAVGLLDNGLKVPLAIIPMRSDPEVVADAVVQQWAHWSLKCGISTSILVENNATQEAFVSLVRLVADRSRLPEPPVSGRHTGRNKWNPDSGLPSLNVEFGQRRWIIPFAGGHSEPFHRCPICDWTSEMLNWGKHIDDDGQRVTSDTIMACWLASGAIDGNTGFADAPVVSRAAARPLSFGPPSRGS